MCLRIKRCDLKNALDYRTKRYGNGLMTEIFKSFSEFVPRAKNEINKTSTDVIAEDGI